MKSGINLEGMPRVCGRDRIDKMGSNPVIQDFLSLCLDQERVENHRLVLTDKTCFKPVEGISPVQFLHGHLKGRKPFQECHRRTCIFPNAQPYGYRIPHIRFLRRPECTGFIAENRIKHLLHYNL